MTRFPLLVQLEFHPDSSEAAEVAERLHRALNEDPAVPGLRIATCFTPFDGTDEPPEPRLATEADRVLVVMLADDHLVTRAQRATPSARTWADYFVRLRALCEETPVHRFMPVQITEHAWPIDARLQDLSFLRAWVHGTAETKAEFIARRVVHLLLRRLGPNTDEEDAPPLTIFLSHTKLDLGKEPHVVKALLEHLVASQPAKTWFDSGDIAAGSVFAREIERGVKDSALMAVVTDSFSSRAWCRREILLAKQYHRPVVVVDAVQRREVRRFPYAGNVPVLRWGGRPDEAVDLLLRESLRLLHAEAVLDSRKRPGDVILPACPELVTLVRLPREGTVLYPDPPLGAEEAEVIEDAGFKIATPLQRHAQENQLASRSLTVALSISEPEDISRYGLRQAHMDAAQLEFARFLLLAGIRLAYGGHLGDAGYTVRLADLLRDPILDLLRGMVPAAAAAPQQLVNYLAWPTFSTDRDEAKLGGQVEIRTCPRPANVDESLDPALVAAPLAKILADSPARRFAWARGLTEMRQRQVAETHGRVIIGGRLGAAAPYYQGSLPGVLEEAVLTVRAGKPLYVVGAFGGCSRLVFDALEGTRRDELAWEFQRRVPFSAEAKQMYASRGLKWDECEEIFEHLKGLGLGGLANGLSPAENRELATTRSAERMIELVLAGLTRLYPEPGAKKEV